MTIPENSELEQETATTTSEISSEEVQRDSPVAGIHRKRLGTTLQVYKRRTNMTKVVPTVIKPELDERI